MWGSIVGKAVDQAIDVGKSWLNYNSQKHQFADSLAFSREQLAFQKELLNNQLQWRVADAQKAGLHPMAAIGLSPSSFSPISAPSGGGADLQLGSTDFAGLGQNVDRAIMAGKTKEQREKAEELQDLEIGLRLEKMRRENDILKLEYDQRRFNLDQSLSSTQPALSEQPLIPGQADSPSLRTGLRSPEKSAYHVWDMGNGNFDILMNPDYQTTIGDEFGQVATTLKAIARAKQGVWINPEDGVTYVFDSDTGYFKRLSSLSNEEARRLLGSPSSRSSGVNSSFRERNKYRYR